jgi:hypothetical protein
LKLFLFGVYCFSRVPMAVSNLMAAIHWKSVEISGNQSKSVEITAGLAIVL